MDVTVDTLLNQFSQTVLDKLDKQSFDPKFLQNLLENLLGKFVYKQTNVIEQPKPKQSQKNEQGTGIVDGLKKAYNDLLKDTTYINNYKLFLKKVYGNSLLNQTNLTPAKDSEKTNFNNKKTTTQIATNTENKNNIVSNAGNTDIEEGRKSLIRDDNKPLVVLLGGITNEGYKDLQSKLPSLLKGLLSFKQPDKPKEKPQGLGLIGGGIALLLGGLAALVTGLMTDGPFKGLLKILSKVGIIGGIKLLEAGAKMFLSSLKQVIAAPFNILKSATKAIGSIFGKGAYKAILTPIRAAKGLFTKMLGGLVKFVTPFLKKIPLIGTIISFGFAFTRFKSGDVIGGIIDVLSGIASIFPGVGTAIAIGLDVLNAFLDFKAGGANKKAGEKKTGILGDWLKGLGKLVLSGLKSLPIIGPLIKSIEEFSAGNYLKGLKQLAYIATPLEFIGALLGDKEASGMTKTAASVFRGVGGILKDLGVWVAKTIWKVLSNIPILGPALKGAQELFSGNFGKAFKQFLYINPAFELLGALLGDQDVGGVTGTLAGTIKSIGGLLKDLGSWVFKQITKLPVLGPLIKMVGNFTNGEWKEGLKNLGRAVGLGGLISFFESKPDESGDTKETTSFSPFKALKNAVMEKARNWWKKAWSWVRWLARRVLPSGVIKALDNDLDKKDDTINVDEPQGSKSLISPEVVAKLKDAMKKVLSNVKEKIQGALQKTSETLTNIPSKLKDMFSSLGNGIKNIASNIWGGIKNTVGGIKDKVHSWWKNSSVKKVLDTGIDTVKSWYNDLVKNSKNLGETLKNTRDKIFNKVSGFFKNMTNNVTSGIKNWWDNLSWDPRSWIGLAPKQNQAPNTQTPIPQTAQKTDQKQDLNNQTNSNTSLTTNDEKNTTSSVTNLTSDLNSKPTIQAASTPDIQKTISTTSTDTALSLNKLLDPQQFSLNNSSLNKIAANTNDTNTSLKNLSEALFRLATVFDKKMSNSGNTTIISNNGQQTKISSASEIANSNSDPIRRVRLQFA